MKHLSEEHGKEYSRRKNEVKYMYKKKEITKCNVDFDRHLDIALAHIDAFEMETSEHVSFKFINIFGSYPKVGVFFIRDVFENT